MLWKVLTVVTVDFFFRHVRISVVEPTPQATQQHIGRTQWRGDRENKAAS